MYSVSIVDNKNVVSSHRGDINSLEEAKDIASEMYFGVESEEKLDFINTGDDIVCVMGDVTVYINVGQLN